MGENQIYLSHRQLHGCTGHEAGRQLLKELYRNATGAPLPPIAKSSRGKPYFPGNNWHFSISHTRHHAFCALAPFPVGLDAEETDRKIDLRLADKILSPNERAQFDAAGNKQQALLTFWVLKEAAGKLSGQGINGYPKYTDFSLDDPRVTVQHGCLVAILTED